MKNVFLNVLKIFVKFIGKHMCWSLFLNKVAIRLRPTVQIAHSIMLHASSK